MARHPELLIPASSLEVLKTAVVFGADAVYIGGEAFGLRAKAKNFSKEDMMEGIRFAHEHDVKVYVTANILAHNYDLEGVREYFKELKEIKPDALIIADPGVFEIAKEVCPEIEIQIMQLICSGTEKGRAELYLQENFPCVRSKKSVHISRMIWRLRHSYTVQCVFLIPEDVCSVISLQAGMQTMAHAPIRAAGNILLWKKPVRENICRFMKMREERIFSIQKISV